MVSGMRDFDDERSSYAPPIDPLHRPPERREAPRRDRSVPYWDRPKPPRDWYWFLGRLGQTLIVAGVLMFMFVGYQLWGTGIEEAQSQDRLEKEFSTLISYPADSPSTDTGSNDTGNGSAATDSGDTTAVVDSRPREVAEGDAIAIIEMPAIGVTKYVVAGVATADLKRGPGHFPSTVGFGQLGNSAIAGHRTTYGEPFRKIDDLAVGDEIVITDLLGRRFVYLVTGQQIVQPEDSWVVSTTDPDRAVLTLTTCHPEFSASQRFVVSAELDLTRSTPAERPAAVYLADGAINLPGEDSVSASDTPSSPPDTTQAGTTQAGTTQAGTTQAGTTQAGTTQAVTTEPDIDDSTVNDSTVNDATDSVEAFSEGWFSDPAAWPHVIGWVLLEILVVVASWSIARRWRNRLLGVAVALVPFFVVLYFVFQNVNRLLPPNL